MRRILPLVLAGLLSACAPAVQAMPQRSEGEVSSPVTSPVSSRVGSAGAGDRQGGRALFFGDSFFIGGGCSPDPKLDMAWRAGERLDYSPVVRGGGGTGFVMANPEYNLPAYLGQIRDGALDTKNPRLVVIEGGANDVGTPLDQIRKNARKVLTIARDKYPTATLILVGPMDTIGRYAETKPIRDVLREVARSLQVPFVDPLKWTAGHDDWLCADFLHPTYEAHIPLGRMLAKALARRGG